MMGGSITVESEYGKGSVFTVEVKQGVADSQTIGEETAESLRNFRYEYESRFHKLSEREQLSYGEQLSGKVLVVDDVPANLLVANGLLEPYSLTVHTASSGKEALDRVNTEDEPYDLIFMDHRMPGIDGIETAKAIREYDPKVSIVMMTANAMHGMKEFYLEQGFQGYISKPINPVELDEVVRRTIKKEKSEKVKEKKAEGNLFAAAMGAGRLDMLNHYRVSFEKGSEFDAAYFERFTALVDSIASEDLNAAEKNSHGGTAAQREERELEKLAAFLIAAGKTRDTNTIKEKLPVFYEALSKGEEKKEERTDAGLNGILSQLKEAILGGEEKNAEKILGEMGALSLEPSERELYFLLYDFLFEGEGEKAIGAINLWERMP
jgi:CheY-like chemotaxis protein